jgi:WD40 repeat protein
VTFATRIHLIDLWFCCSGFSVDPKPEESNGPSLSSSILQLAQTTGVVGGNTIVASGEFGLHPTIFVWEINTGSVLSSMQGFHKGGIHRLDFSPNREMLISLGEYWNIAQEFDFNFSFLTLMVCLAGKDPYHSIAVYTWINGNRIWSARSTCNVVNDIKFLSDKVFACCGEKHVYFWTTTTIVTSDVSRASFKKFRGQG